MSMTDKRKVVRTVIGRKAKKLMKRKGIWYKRRFRYRLGLNSSGDICKCEYKPTLWVSILWILGTPFVILANLLINGLQDFKETFVDWWINTKALFEGYQERNGLIPIRNRRVKKIIEEEDENE